MRGVGARPIRVLLADDHAVVRRGLKMVLESEDDLRVVSEASDGSEAVRRAIQDDVDLAVLDLSMPGMSGLQVTRELLRLRPQVRVVILSMHDNEQYVAEAVRAGAGAYVLKTDGGRTLIQACRAAARGEPFVQPTPGRPRAHAIDREARAADVALTPREAQVLSLIADGHTSREIASVLVISPRTVERHREKLLKKLNLRNRVELTRYALRIQLLDP
jgi:DNA-binding NarL/FixJ family response regulator